MENWSLVENQPLLKTISKTPLIISCGRGKWLLKTCLWEQKHNFKALITRYNQLKTMLKVLVLLSVTSFKLPFNAVTKKLNSWIPLLFPLIPASQPHKKNPGNPTLAHYWNSHFPDPASVFSRHPKYHDKKSPNSPSHQSYCEPSLLWATKRARHLLLVSSTWDFTQFCPHSWNTRVVLTNMHGMWPQRPWYWV